MELKFSNLIGKHRGKKALIIAHGPSLNMISPALKECLKKNFILIATNDWYLFHKEAVPHYSVMANSVFTIERMHKKLNQFPTTIVYADSVDRTGVQRATQLLKVDFLPYDQKHFNGKKCPSCRKGCRIVPGRLTIQEELKKYTGSTENYGPGDTVCLHQIALGILLGCNPVFFVGMDLDYRKGFAKNTGGKSSNSRDVHIGTLSGYRERILKHLKIIAESATLKGVKVINLNKKSDYDTVPIGSLDGYL